MAKTDEKELLDSLYRALQENDREQYGQTFERIYHAYYHLLCFVASHFLSERQDQEDAAEEAFVLFAEALHPQKPVKHLARYLCTITENIAKKQMSRGTTEALEEDDVGSVDMFIQGLGLSEDLSKAFNHLNQNQRDIVVYRIVMELPYRDIARLMGLSVPACDSLFRRAMKTLKKQLEENYGPS